MVTIGINLNALRANRQISAATQKVSATAERLSSGQRINRASDDAAGLAVATSLNTNSRIFTQAIRNVNDVLSLTSISTSALSQLSEITIRQRELATQSANGTYSSKQREAMDTEARALTNEYNRIILTTKFNGIQTLANPWDVLQTQAGVGDAAILSSKFADELSTKVTAGSYFTVDGIDDKYYVWFTLDGKGSDPHGPGTGVQVDLATTAIPGNITTPAVEGSGSGSVGDGSTMQNGDYFYLSAPGDNYYVYFNVDGLGSDPIDPDGRGASGIEVQIDSSDDAGTVASKVAAELNGTGSFSANSDGFGGITWTNTAAGASAYDAYSNFINAGNIQQDISGADAIGQQAVAVTITGTQIRDAVRTALNGTGSFSTQIGADGALMVTNLVSGTAAAVTDVSTGIVISDPVNSGTGRSSFAVGDAPGFVSFYDANGDGELDMFTSNLDDGTVTINLGRGDGTFSNPTSYKVAANGLNLQHILGDLNGDGKVDLVAASGAGSAVVRMGFGDGTFGAATTYAMAGSLQDVKLVDVDRDGKLDMVTAGLGGSVSVRKNNGNGTFAANTVYSAGGSSRSVASSDLNGDGIQDLVTGNWTSASISVLIGNADGSFSSGSVYSAGAVTGQVAIADLNGDGIKDIVSGDEGSNTVSVFLGNANGTFRARTSYAGGTGPYAVTLRDMDRDGNLDILTGENSSTHINVLLGNGNGTFRARTSYVMGSDAGGIAVEDLNNDGFLDLATRNYANDMVSVRLASGVGTFASDSPATMRLFFGDGRGTALVNQINLKSKYGAKEAMTALDDRLQRIASQIAVYGSNESRLDVALNTLAVSRENYLSAESRIKDADIAQETAAYVSSSITQRVASEILGQAKLIPQIALSLLDSASSSLR